MAQRSVRKMLNKQAKLTGRTAGNGLKTTPKRRILPGVVQKSPLRSTPARKILPGVVQKPKNKQRSVASMRATQRRLRKG